VDHEDETVSRVPRDAFTLQWPRRVLGPPPGLLEINLACWGLFAGFVVAPFVVAVWIHLRAGDGWDYLLPCDFVYFYGIGRIAHEYPFSRLYEYGLLLKVTNEIFPMKDYFWGPSPYPPFVALLFSLFARISFLPAYLLWMGVLLLLYLGGIAATVQGVFAKQPLKTSLVLCLSLGFYPFFICTLKNGQLSAFAVFAAGIAIFQERNGRPFWGGLVLSILIYKPTLLVLLVPMLLLTRRFRMLSGFVTGAIALLLLTTSICGVGIWPIYYRHSLGFMGQFIESHGQSVLQLWEYVDFHSLSYSIPGGRSTAGLAILSCISIAAAAGLAVTLWRSSSESVSHSRPAQDLAWAATLTWTLLLNLYVPVWDSTLVVIAVILTLRALRTLGWSIAAGWTTFLALLIFGVAWNIIAPSNRHGSQLMMLLLVILGLVQLALVNRVIRQGSPRQESLALAVS
jgi:hypothetical protein